MSDFMQSRLDAYARFRGTMDYIIKEMERTREQQERLLGIMKAAEAELTKELDNDAA